MDSRQLAIPIYLNQRIVFDLLAIVEGGFSELQTVRSSESSSDGHRSGISGELGVSNIFAFLGMKLGHSRTEDNSAQRQQEVVEERVFTPASLFPRLRGALKDHELLHAIDRDSTIASVSLNSFVEFSAVLEKSPLIAALESFVEIGGLNSIFGDTTQDKSAHQTASRKQAKGKAISAESPITVVIHQIERLLTTLNHSNHVDLVATIENSQLRAVIPVDLAYFVDRTPAAIIDGEFVVLGKVVRIVADPCDAIDLLRGTSLGYLSEDMVEEFTATLSNPEVLPFKIPTLITKVIGPAIQVIPIAIYA